MNILRTYKYSYSRYTQASVKIQITKKNIFYSIKSKSIPVLIQSFVNINIRKKLKRESRDKIIGAKCLFKISLYHPEIESY